MGRFVLIRFGAVAIAAIAVAVAGCYRPEVGSCFLRCGANNACPDDLTCNSQRVCASTPSTMCDELPMDDAGVDTPQQPVLTTVTLDVVSNEGVGQNDIYILFSTPDGEMIKDTRTPASGHVVVDEIPVGSAVTIVRPTGASYNATTHLDLWPDAHIVSRFSPPTEARIVTINWQAPSPAPPSSSFYYVYSTCFNGEQSTNNMTLGISVTSACPRLDVIVVVKNQMVPLYVASVADVTGINPVNITTGMWNPFSSGDVIDANVSNLTGTARLQLSGYVTPAYAYTTPLVETDIPPSGDASPVTFPVQLGATASTTSSVMIGNEYYQQLDVERLPPGTTTFDRDMGTRQFPWINNARIDVPTKTLSWPIQITNGMMYVQPAIVYARVSFRRGPDSHNWHIIAPGNRIASTTTMGSFVLPEIPGDRPFEPTNGDTNFIDELTYFGTTPGLEDEVRGVLESHEQRLDMFGIDGLTYVHRATAI